MCKETREGMFYLIQVNLLKIESSLQGDKKSRKLLFKLNAMEGAITHNNI